jgi:hypothetical protein
MRAQIEDTSEQNAPRLEHRDHITYSHSGHYKKLTQAVFA